MDGLLALDLWDLVIDAPRSNKNNIQPNHTILRKLTAVQPNHTSHYETGTFFDSEAKNPIDKRKQKVDQMFDVDNVPTNTHSSQGEKSVVHFWRQRGSD